jgi:hypothetical protein
MRKTLPLIFIFFTISGCVAGLNYKKLGNHLKSGSCPQAITYIEKNEKNYGSNERLLFLLDSAIVNMMCGNYEKSNEYLHSAEALAEDLWTKSFTRETASFFLNDYTIPYAGEEFERALINLLSAINYVRLGQYEEALVECRRLDVMLTALNDKYEKKNIYKEDAFGRYLSGIIYEATDNLDDAYIDYFKALQVFNDYERNYNTPVPQILLKDIFRIAETTDRLEEVEPFLKGYDTTTWLKYSDIEDSGRIIFIHFNGISPVKKEDKLVIPTKEGPITLAFPKYVVTPPYCRNSKVIVESNSIYKETDAELVEDINKIAVKNLEDRKARVIAKTVARAAVKKVTIHSIAKDRMTEQLLNIANIIIERADTRSWRTLPGEIYLSSLFLPEGKYHVYISQCGGEKTIVETVRLRAGETRFVLFESMY